MNKIVKLLLFSLFYDQDKKCNFELQHEPKRKLYSKNVFLESMLFLPLVAFIFPSKSHADWPLWRGGTVKNIQAFDKNGKPLCRNHSDRQCRPTSYLQRIEVYRLDHAEDSRWKLVLNQLGFTAYWKAKIGSNYEFKWRICCKIPFIFKTDQIVSKTKKGKVFIFKDQKTGKTPLAISETFNSHRSRILRVNWLYDLPTFTANKGKQKIIGGREGEYITFEVTKALQGWLPNAQGETVGLLISNYGTFRIHRSISSGLGLLLGYFGYHTGVDLAAQGGTSLSFLRPQKSLYSTQVLPIKIANPGGSNEHLETIVWDSKGKIKEYHFSHIRTSDVIRMNQTYHPFVKLGEVGKQHPINHLHFEVNIKTNSGKISPENPLETIIDRTDPKLLEKIRVIPSFQTGNKNQWIIFKRDDAPSSKGLVSTGGKISTVQGNIDIIARVADPTGLKYPSTSAVTGYFVGGAREAQYRIYFTSQSQTKPRAIPIISRTFINSDVFKTYLPIHYIPDSKKVFFGADVMYSRSFPHSEQSDLYYILTNNTDPTGSPQKISKKGTWDTSFFGKVKKGQTIPKYIDGKYKVEVRFSSDFSRPVISGKVYPEWSAWKGDGVIVDNTAPKLLSHGVLGKVDSSKIDPIIGTIPEAPAKIGDLIKMRLKFDQPMEPKIKPLIKLALKLSGPWFPSLSPNLWTLFPAQAPFIEASALQGISKLPDLTSKNPKASDSSKPKVTKYFFQVSKATGIGAFSHGSVQGKKLGPDEMFPTTGHSESTKQTNFIYADLETPTFTYERKSSSSKITVTCTDSQTGIRACDATASWLDPKSKTFVSKALSPQKPQPPCKGKRKLTDGPKTVVVSSTDPGEKGKACGTLKQFTIQVTASDCAGNKVVSAKTPISTNSSGTITQIDFKLPDCGPVAFSDGCTQITYPQSCSEEQQCMITQSLGSKKTKLMSVPGCDHPDENVDLSTHNERVASLRKQTDSNSPVAILDSRYSHQTIRLLGRFGLKAALIPVTFSPEIYKKHPILVIPTAGLTGQSGNRALKAALEGYVKQGGRLLVLAQAWDKEWQFIPGNPRGKGYNEAISCLWNTTTLSRRHVAFSSLTSPDIGAPTDGHLTSLPPKAVVILRKKLDQLPNFAYYPYGKGLVTATTMYIDWADYWSQSSFSGQNIIRDYLTWLTEPTQIPIHSAEANIKQTLSFKHLGKKQADFLRIRVLTPNRDKIVFHKQYPKNVKAGSQISFELKYQIGKVFGIYHTEVTLLSKSGVVVFGPIELHKGRNAVDSASKKDFLRKNYRGSLYAEIDTPPQTLSRRTKQVEVTIRIKNELVKEFKTPRTLHVYINSPNNKQTVSLGAKKEWKTTFQLKIPANAPSSLPIRVVFFDEDAPKSLHQPSWTKEYKDPWIFANAAATTVRLAEPNIIIGESFDRSYYKPGAKVAVKLQLKNPKDVSFPCRIQLELITQKQKSIWNKQWDESCAPYLQKTLQTDIQLPKDEYGQHSLHIRVFDMAGGQPFLIQQKNATIQVPRPSLKLVTNIPQSISKTTPITLKVTNTGHTTVTKITVTAELKDPKGLTVKTFSKTITSLDASLSTDISLDLLPTQLKLGDYTVSYKATTEGESWNGNKTIPSSLQLLIKPELGYIFLKGTLKVSTYIQNTGRFELSPSIFWKFQTITGLLHGQQGPSTPKVIKPGEIAVVLTPVTQPAHSKGGVSEIIVTAKLPSGSVASARKRVSGQVPQPRMFVHIPGNTVIPGKVAAITVSIEPHCCFVPPLNATLTVIASGLNFSHTSTVTLTSTNPHNFNISMPIPANAIPGHYKLDFTFTLPSKETITQTRYVLITGPHLVLQAPGTTQQAGQTLAVVIENKGSLPTSFQWTGSLTTSYGKVVTQNVGTQNLTASSTGKLSLPLRTDLPTGQYRLQISAEYGKKKATLDTHIYILGASASLSLTTSQSIYSPQTSILGQYTITGSQTTLTGASLLLRVFQNKRIDGQSIPKHYPKPLDLSAPWPAYRGSPQRLGAALGTGLFHIQHREYWKTSLAPSSGTKDLSPSGAVIGDVDGDGKLDIVGTSSTGSVVALRGKDGSFIWKAVVGAKPGAAIGNIDGKPGLEVIVTGNQCRVMALSGKTGASIWNISLGAVCHMVGQPLIVDLDADGKPEIVLTAAPTSFQRSFPRVLAILDGATGKVKISVSSNTLGWVPPSPPSVADLGLPCLQGRCNAQTATLDNKKEILSANHSRTDNTSLLLGSAFGLSGSMRWQLRATIDQTAPQDSQEKAQSLPVIADIDGDGRKEIIMLRGFFDSSNIQVLHSSNIVVLDGNTGQEKWSKTLGLPLADGLIVIPTGTKTHNLLVYARPKPNTAPEVILFDHAGKELWRKTIGTASITSATLHVTDLTGDHKSDLLLQTATKNGLGAGLYLLDLATRNIHKITQTSSTTPPVTIDLDGDGASEIITGSRNGQYIVLTGPGHQGSFVIKSGGRYHATQADVWIKKIPVIVSKGNSTKGNQLIPAIPTPGQYILEGTLQTQKGLPLATKRIYFYVAQSGSLVLKATTGQDAYRFGTKVSLEGALHHTLLGSLTNANIKITTSSGKVIFQKGNITLLVGQQENFTATWTPTQIGNQVLLLEASSGRNTTKLEIPIQILVPLIEMDVSAPKQVNAESFEVNVSLTNKSTIDANVLLTLSGGAIKEQQQVFILAGQTSLVSFSVKLTKDTTLTLKAEQDLKTTHTLPIRFGLKATLQTQPPKVATPGLITFPYTLSSQNKISGSVAITCTHATDQRILYQASHFLPTGSFVTKGRAQIILEAGTHTIKCETYGSSSSFSIKAETANGKLTFSQRTTFETGQPITIPFLLENLAPSQEEFRINFELSKASTVIQNITQTLLLDRSGQTGGKQSSTITIPQLAAGNYTLMAHIYPGVTKETFTFSVAPTHKLTLVLEKGRIQGSNYRLDARLENKGVSDFSGILHVNAGFISQRVDISIKSGAKVSIPLSFSLQKALPGKRTVLINISKRSGEVLVEKTHSFIMLQPILSLTPPQGPLSFAAGTIGRFAYILQNQSSTTQVADFTLALLEQTHQRKFSINPGQSVTFTIETKIFDDLEEREYTAIYRLSANPGVKLLPTRAGLTRFQVTGIKVEVKAKLDQHAYRSQETAKLKLLIRSTGTQKEPEVTLRIRYGQFEKTRLLVLSSAWKEVEIEVPLGDLKHHNLGFQVFSKGNRSLYIDSLLVHRKTEKAWLTTTKDVYKPGEALTYSIHTTAETKVTIQAIDGLYPSIHKADYTIKKEEKQDGTFFLPKTLVGGSHTIEYKVGKTSHKYRFNCQGPLVFTKSLTLAKQHYQPGEIIQAELILETFGTYLIGTKGLALEIVFSIRETSGVIHQTGVIKQISIKKGRSLVLADIPVPQLKLGELVLVAEVYLKGQRNLPLSQASARFETGDFQLRAIHPTKESFALGFEDGQLKVSLFASKSVTGNLAVHLEGRTIYTKEHTFNGFYNIIVSVPRANLPRTGAYAVGGFFTVDGEGSQASNILNVEDTGAPLIEVIGVTNNQFYNKTVQAQIKVYGSHLLTDEISSTLSGFPYASGSPITKEGPYKLLITAKDTRGRSSHKELKFTLDLTPPQVLIEGIKQGGKYDSVTPRISVKDEHPGSLLIKFDGKVYQKGTTIRAKGWHSLTATAQDKAGNEAQTSVSFIIGKDISGILKIITPTSGYISDTPLIAVKGRVLATDAKVSVDGIPVSRSVKDPGAFTTTAHLQQCDGTIRVTAKLGTLSETKTIPVKLSGKHTVASQLKVLHSFDAKIGGVVLGSDKIWVSLPSQGRILRASFKKQSVGKFEKVNDSLKQPTILALTPQGNLVALDAKSGILFQFDAEGQKETLSPSLESLESFTINTKGEIFGSTGTNQVWKLEKQQWKIWSTLPEKSRISSLIFEASNQTMWAVDSGNQMIWKLKDGKSERIGELSFAPKSLAIGTKGELWIGGNHSSNIYLYQGKKSVVYQSFANLTSSLLVTSKGSLLSATGKQLLLSQPKTVDCKVKQHPEGTNPVGCGCSISTSSPFDGWPLLVCVLFFLGWRKK